MSPLSDDQKQLLFDHSIGLTSQSESAQAEDLISSSQEAAAIHKDLRAALAPLDSLEPEPCPDGLAERTVSRLVGFAESGHEGLEQLLADEQSHPVTIKVGFWRNVGEMVAVAAAIMLIAGVLLPVFNRGRHTYWKQRCQSQLSSIFQGLKSYVSDYDQRPPSVAAQPGQQWNTRCIYLPVKLGYLRDAKLFICPGRGGSRTVRFDISRASEYSDFPSRESITYSPRRPCSASLSKQGLCEGAILADKNPIFDDWPSQTDKKQLDEASLSYNSKNHRRKGQNVLYDDGRVEFLTIRRLGTTQDDIFTLENMCPGSEVNECEMLPSREDDVFMAP
jgi:hypothetical protein